MREETWIQPKARGLEGADKARALEAAATLDGRPHAGAKQLAGVATNLGKVGALLRAREGHPRVVEETAMKRRRHHRMEEALFRRKVKKKVRRRWQPAVQGGGGRAHRFYPSLDQFRSSALF